MRFFTYKIKQGHYTSLKLLHQFAQFCWFEHIAFIDCLLKNGTTW